MGRKYYIGYEFETKKYGKVVITNLYDDKVDLKFIDTGYEAKGRSLSCLASKNIKDPYKPSVFDVGYFGNGKHRAREKGSGKRIESHQRWENMMARCYYPKTSRYESYGGIGVTVCKEWHNYQVFAEWYYENYIEGYHLDGDIFMGDTKVYSPETCCFVPQGFNNLFVNKFKNTKKDSGLPEGVMRERNRYNARVMLKGKVLFSKSFNTIDDAVEFYNKHKTQIVREQIKGFYDRGEISERVYNKVKDYEFKNIIYKGGS